jgi:hypothetical protein
MVVLGCLLALAQDPMDEPMVGGLPLAASEGLLEATLPNGLRITIIGDPVLAMSAVAHQIGVGAAHEQDGQEGLAHLVEHMLFEVDEPFDRWVEDQGGYANAWTGYDATSTVSTVPPDVLLALIEKEAERFAALPVDAAELAREKDVVADEVRLRDDLEPTSRFAIGLRSGILDGHVYGRPVGAVPAVDAEQVSAFHAAYYGAKNVRLIAVGPHDPDAVYEVIAQRYAAMPPGDAVPPVARVELGEGRVRVRGEGLRVNEVGLAWPLPAGRPCGDVPSASCTPSYWVDRVVLELFETAGVAALERSLSSRTLAYTQVTATSWQGASGGYVVALAHRRSGAGIAAHNTAGGVLVFVLGVAGVDFAFPFRSNPSARMLRRVLSDRTHEWITDAAIEHARAAVRQGEIARLWSADGRAMALASKLALGLAADESMTRQLADIDRAGVLSRYHEIFGAEARIVRAR